MFGLVLARPSPNKLICLLAVFCIRYEVETKYIPNFADMLHCIACANLFFTLKQEPEFLPTAFAVILKPV